MPEAFPAQSRPAPIAASITAPIIAIDLGTTNSLVAIADPTPRILPDALNRPMLPSVVRFDEHARPIELGYPARRSSLVHPRSTIASVKRLMGRTLEDARTDLPYLSYEVVAGPNNAARVALPMSSPALLSSLPSGGPALRAGSASGQTDPNTSSNTNSGTGVPPVSESKPHNPTLISPQEVSAIILRALREQASSALNQPITRAVITVPAYFDDAQRQATRDAARLAGLEPVRILNEPTAAALAYGLGQRHALGSARDPELVIIYDLGGGTFDLSILRIIPASTPSSATTTAPTTPADVFQVLATAGDTHLGGDDFDTAILTLLLADITRDHPALAPHIAASPHALQALRQAAETAKITLSTELSTTISLDIANILNIQLPSTSDTAQRNTPHPPASNAPIAFTRTLTRPELEALIAPLVERTIACCQRALRDARRAIDADPITAVILVGGATRTPLVRQRVESFFKPTPYTALDPDQVVALGAAVQASILDRANLSLGSPPGSTSGSASAPSALLLDVVPLSLGLETVGGAMAKLIMRNSAVPAAASETFSTSVDNQTGIKLHILQGEREMASDCRSLARLELKGIPPMPAGIPKLKVEFRVDASGILTVHANEIRSAKRLTAQIVPNLGLDQSEVERLERDALTNARDDMQRHRVVDLIANSRLDVKWITDQLAKHAQRLAPAASAAITADIANLRGLIDNAERDWRSVDANAFHAAKESLDRASMPLHEASIAASLSEDTQPHQPHLR